MKDFEKIKPEKLTDNPFKLIGDDWFLITAGTKEHFNTMTGGWGHFGILWNKPTALIYVRPTRYTFEFTERHPLFTLCFFTENQRHILNYCGKFSGRHKDKVRETGLTPEYDAEGFIWFREARLVVKCRKIYSGTISPENFHDERINSHYPLKDYHTQYIGEIIECLIKK
ncbi:MAG TPA: flavin reductase [Bacteroidia bacterium]|nr:flavin reductase [Bacteroidia bacterium]HRS58059.1 flavin reductase [Bacteroidia bacterium]HRU66923.1 flavin reductase [Bacteroidia bacterium]